jgi:teichuronic acid biosynthesis glycosyltransferase TuaC
MVRIFYLSQQHPCQDNPINEEFISSRIKKLRAEGHVCDVHFLITKYSYIYAIVQKMLGGADGQDQTMNITKDGITWIGFTHKIDLKDSLLRRLNSVLYQKSKCEKIADTIMSKVDFSKYDLIHCHIPFPEGYVGTILSQKTELPLVITCHGSDIHTYPQLDPAVKSLTVSAITKANKVIFVSKSLLETAKELGYSGENAVVIPNGVDTSLFTIQDRELQKKKQGMSGKVIGFVGNLKVVKRADKFPEIFKRIHEKRKNTEFIIVGDGELRKSIAEECNKLNIKIRFTGVVPPCEVPDYINAMDVLILPSRNEGFGCVILEAQACGVPVVGSDRGGIPSDRRWGCNRP